MTLIFLILAAISVISALAVISFRSPVYSVLSLIVCFFSVAGNYLLVHATFLAIVNIIVYAGAIMVLFLFVIMLLNLNKGVEGRKPALFQLAAVGVGSLLLLILVTVSVHGNLAQGSPGVLNGSLKPLSRLLFGEYAIPFELSSILFLTAIVGVVLLSRSDNRQENRQ